MSVQSGGLSRAVSPCRGSCFGVGEVLRRGGCYWWGCAWRRAAGTSLRVGEGGWATHATAPPRSCWATNLIQRGVCWANYYWLLVALCKGCLLLFHQPPWLVTDLDRKCHFWKWFFCVSYDLVVKWMKSLSCCLELKRKMFIARRDYLFICCCFVCVFVHPWPDIIFRDSIKCEPSEMTLTYSLSLTLVVWFCCASVHHL